MLLSLYYDRTAGTQETARGGFKLRLLQHLTEYESPVQPGEVSWLSPGTFYGKTVINVTVSQKQLHTPAVSFSVGGFGCCNE